MKKCQNCSFENTDLMNFCMECGTSLPSATGLGEQQTVVYNEPTTLQTGDQQTVAYNPNTPPTNPNNSVEAQTVVRNRYTPPPPPNTVVQNNLYSPTPQIPPQNKGNSNAFWIIGGILGLLILVGGAIIGIAAIAYFAQRDVSSNPTPYPTSYPTATPGRTTPTPFNLKNSPTPSDSSAPVGDFTDLWVDYNVREGGKLGMKVHVSFTARNMKNVDSYLAIYLQKNDGTPIYGKYPGYVAKTKQVAAFQLLRPAYDPAEYKDLAIFIPYAAFGLGKGMHYLQLNVNLIYKADGLINQLTVYDFEFEQK